MAAYLRKNWPIITTIVGAVIALVVQASEMGGEVATAKADLKELKKDQAAIVVAVQENTKAIKANAAAVNKLAVEVGKVTEKASRESTQVKELADKMQAVEVRMATIETEQRISFQAIRDSLERLEKKRE